eukprot:2101356-Heterocapsa_arctica.AAC.1
MWLEPWLGGSGVQPGTDPVVCFSRVRSLMSAQGLRLLPGPVVQDPKSSSSWLESVGSKSTP